jgi:hypothetical protein
VAVTKWELWRRRILTGVALLATAVWVVSLALAYAVAPSIPIIVAGFVPLAVFFGTLAGLIPDEEGKSGTHAIRAAVLGPSRRLLDKAGRSTRLTVALLTALVVFAFVGWRGGRGGIRAVNVLCGDALAVQVVDAAGQVKTSGDCTGRGTVMLNAWAPFSFEPECVYKFGNVAAAVEGPHGLACVPRFYVARRARSQPRLPGSPTLRIEHVIPVEFNPFARYRFTLRNTGSAGLTLGRIGVRTDPIVQHARTSPLPTYALDPLDTIDIDVHDIHGSWDILLLRPISLQAGEAVTVDARFVDETETPGVFTNPGEETTMQVIIEFVVEGRTVQSEWLPLSDPEKGDRRPRLPHRPTESR